MICKLLHYINNISTNIAILIRKYVKVILGFLKNKEPIQNVTINSFNHIYN